jgi:CBS domain-containing protein
MPRQARDVMQSPVLTIERDASLLDAHRLFVEEEIHGAPVVDSDGGVVGVLSTLDLLRVVSEEHDSNRSDAVYYRDLLPYSVPDWATEGEDFQDRLSELRVADAMSDAVVSVPPDATIAQVARTLRENGIHRVLVAEKEKLLGIISSQDLLALLEREEA